LEETKNPHPPNLYDLETEKKDTYYDKNDKEPEELSLDEYVEKIKTIDKKEIVDRIKNEFWKKKIIKMIERDV
jgi:hypothetical protein